MNKEQSFAVLSIDIRANRVRGAEGRLQPDVGQEHRRGDRRAAFPGRGDQITKSLFVRHFLFVPNYVALSDHRCTSTQDCSSIMADAESAGVSAPSGVYEVGIRSGFANVTLRVWCDMDTREGRL